MNIVEPRFRLVSLPFSFITNILDLRPRLINKDGDYYFSVPELTGLPLGYKIFQIRENFITQSIDVLIWHKDFAIVKEGTVPPKIDFGYSTFKFKGELR